MTYKTVAAFIKEEAGQATVELALLIPVVIVVAIIVVQLGFYLEICVRFDRVAEDMVLAHGIAPQGTQSIERAKAEVEDAIRESMQDDNLGIEVSTQKVSFEEGGMFAFNPCRVRFVCTLHFKPLRDFIRIGPVQAQSPFELTHKRSVVVDVGAMAL